MRDAEFNIAAVDARIVDDMACDWSKITTYTYPLGDVGTKIIIYSTSGVKIWECSDEIGKNIIKKLSFVLTENGCAEFSFVLNEKPPVEILDDYRVDIHLFRDANPWFSGYLLDLPEFISSGEEYTYSGIGHNYQLETCRVNQAYNATTFPTQADREISEVIKHIITTYVEPETKIVYNASKITATSPAFYVTDMNFDRVPAKKAIQQLADMAQNYVFGVDADREFFFKPVDTTLNTNAVKFVGKHLAVFMPRRDVGKIRNLIDVMAGKITSGSNYILTVEDTDSQDDYTGGKPRWAKLSIPSALNSADAQRWANYKLSQLKDPTRKARISGIELYGKKIEAVGKAKVMPNKKSEVNYDIDHDTYAEINAGAKNQVTVTETPLEVKLAMNDGADWSLLDEGFTNLNNWSNSDVGAGVSEASPAGQLHQDSNGTSGKACIDKSITAIGTQDYTVEFKIKFGTFSSTDWYEITVNGGTGATNKLLIHFDITQMKIHDGAAYQTAITKTWVADTWYTIRIIVHNSQTDADVYLDNVLQNSDIDCSCPRTDYTTILKANPNASIDTEIHMDYIKIDDGQHAPIYHSSGDLISEWIDLSDVVYRLKTIEWSESLPADTDIEFQTRVNTAAQDAGAEAWRPATNKLTTPAGSQIESSLKRYIQYKALLTTTDTGVTPKLYLNSSKVVKINYSKGEIVSYELQIKKVVYKVSSQGIAADMEVGEVFLPLEGPILDMLRSIKLQEALEQANVKQLS